jgi:RimJ/RimL family protein N-acetyltransferase
MLVDDKAAVFAYRSDVEANKYQGWIPKSIEELEIFIQKMASQINMPGTWFQWAIVEEKSGLIIGDLGVQFIEDNQQVEVGITLDKNFQSQGFASEALRAVIDYLFNHLEKHRIVASVDAENIKSMHLLQKLGFRKEAHFVQSLYINGQWVDDVVFALLESDWELMAN